VSSKNALRLLVVLGFLGFVGAVRINWLSAPRQPSAIDRALDELAVARAANLRAMLITFDIMWAVLEQAWVVTWAGSAQPLPDSVTVKHLCWHISALDVIVDEIPVQVWRCKAADAFCDPDLDDFCIDLGRGSITWEFRTNDNDMGSFTIH